ncbi:unnamed protein product, partial [Heterobilharzia americana]
MLYIWYCCGSLRNRRTAMNSNFFQDISMNKRIFFFVTLSLLPTTTYPYCLAGDFSKLLDKGVKRLRDSLEKRL